MVTTALASRNLPGGGEDRRAAEAVPDQERGRPAGFAQMIGGADEIGDVGREASNWQNSPSLEPRPVKVETQHRDRLWRPAQSAMRFAASTSLPQVKQCAKQRVGMDLGPSGVSSAAAS